MLLRICPICGKNRLYEKENNCPDCLAKARVKNNEYREKNLDLMREKDRMRSKARILNRKALGLCTKCGKRKASTGYSTCSICRIKATEYSHTLERYQGYEKGRYRA